MSGFKDKLAKSATSKSPAKSKSSMPTVKTNVGEAISTFNTEKKNESAAKAAKEVAGAAIIEFGREHQDKTAFTGNFRKSFELIGNDDESVKFVATDKFSVNPDDATNLKKIVGKKEYDNLFEEKFTVTLHDEVFEDEALQNELMALMGDNFDRFLFVSSKLVTKKNFDENIYRVVKSASKLSEVRMLVKQNKPSIR